MQQNKPHKRVIVVLPAYNAEATVKQTYDDIPKEWVDDIILVDDGSWDNTVEAAQRLGITTIRHKKNRGYGANQKTCYQEALKRGAEIIIMVHPDHQYDPKFIPQIIEPFYKNGVDAVFGSRMITKGGALEGGMPYWKYLANIMLTMIENVILRLNLTEYHSGFRAYSRRALESISFTLNSDKFVFDTEIIIQLKIHAFKIKEIPITTKYFKDASTIGLLPSIRYGIAILLSLGKYILHSTHIKKYDLFSKLVLNANTEKLNPTSIKSSPTSHLD